MSNFISEQVKGAILFQSLKESNVKKICILNLDASVFISGFPGGTATAMLIFICVILNCVSAS